MSAPEGDLPSHYEKTHLRGKPFVVGAILFFAFCAVMFWIVWGLLQEWTSERAPLRQPPSPPSADARWNTQVPQVQIDPATDLAKVRATENQHLHALHWNDPAHAYATIPIENAMHLMTDAAHNGQLGSILPAPKPATPLDLQVQKSREAGPPQEPNP